MPEGCARVAGLMGAPEVGIGSIPGRGVIRRKVCQNPHLYTTDGKFNCTILILSIKYEENDSAMDESAGLSGNI